jgi:hypothetical protein
LAILTKIFTSKEEEVMFKIVLVCTALITMAMANPVSSQQSPPTSEQTKRIEAMVNVKAVKIDGTPGLIGAGFYPE